jgi:hypothetical protein
VLTDYITVTDADNNVMALLPNCEYQSMYHQYQIVDTDSWTTPSGASSVEVYFKKKFWPLKNDSDTYFGTDRYDKAIYWKYMELRSKNAEDAVSYQQKCRQVLVDALDNSGQTTKRKINFAPVVFWNMPYYRYADRP